VALTAFLVEDEEVVRETITQMLEHLGLKVTSFSDGESALDKLTRELPDLALVDLVLPGKSDGLQVIGRIIDKYPTVKVIAMSGDNSSESYFRALRLRGVSHALPKPIALDDLAAAISKITGIDIEDLGDDLIG
jgi:CheY-like chemotaxis protein